MRPVAWLSCARTSWSPGLVEETELELPDVGAVEVVEVIGGLAVRASSPFLAWYRLAAAVMVAAEPYAPYRGSPEEMEDEAAVMAWGLSTIEEELERLRGQLPGELAREIEEFLEEARELAERLYCRTELPGYTLKGDALAIIRRLAEAAPRGLETVYRSRDPRVRCLGCLPPGDPCVAEKLVAVEDASPRDVLMTVYDEYGEADNPDGPDWLMLLPEPDTDQYQAVREARQRCWEEEEGED